MNDFVIFLSGLLIGWYAPRAYGFCINVYYKLKHGICFRYLPTGNLENRDGTISDFCRRCGHPEGYHR